MLENNNIAYKIDINLHLDGQKATDYKTPESKKVRQL